MVKNLKYFSLRIMLGLKKILKSIWFFPLILLLTILVLTCLKISGSSIGTYHESFYGNNTDTNLIFGHPRSIRSDEWLVTTQLTIAQDAAGYPRVNPNIDSGRDMSVVGDAPYKDWSMLFKPQNLAFFVLPLEYAFAFKWWLLLALTIVSGYFLTLRILPNKKLFAAIFSTAFACSPFLFWWYSTGVFAPIFYGFFIIILGTRIINGEKVSALKNRRLLYSNIIYIATLTYLLSAFALVLYPPFQIPIAIAMVFFIVGYFLSKFKSKILCKDTLFKLSIFCASAIIAGLLILLFINTRSGVIDAINNTAYPGQRTIQQTGNPLYEITSTFLQPELQHNGHASNFYANQSEASNFILLTPFLFIPSFIFIYLDYKKNKKINWLFMGVQLCILLFFLYLFVPQLKPLYKITFLDQVANNRLYIGLGFIGAIQLLLIVKFLDKIKANFKKINALAIMYSLLCFGVMLLVCNYTNAHYPQFISWQFMIFLSLFLTVILFLFLTKRMLLGAVAFFLFTMGSVFYIHPLYRGLGPIRNSQISQTMKNVSQPGDTWVVLDELMFENFSLINNRKSLSGTKPYPDIKFWSQVDNGQSAEIYNRYAHVLFTESLTSSEPVKLIQADFFMVKFGCASQFIKENADFVLSMRPINASCASLLSVVTYPSISFYIYKIN